MLDDELREAFADAGRPPPPLVRTDKDDAYFLDFEASFAGCPTVHARFLGAHAHQTLDLVPAATRWYWRELLLAAAAAPWDRYHGNPRNETPEIALIHPSVYFLRPNPCAVRARLTSYLDATVICSRFDGKQRLAVAHYLGAVIAAPCFSRRALAYTAAQAVRWCWR